MPDRKDIPWSPEAELSVLGAATIDSEAVNLVMERLTKSHFFNKTNRTIFRAMSRLYEDGVEVDATTLTDALESSGSLEDVGGHSKIAELVDAVPTAANVEYHADILDEKYKLRRLVEVGKKIVQLAGDTESGKAQQTIDTAESLVFRIKEEEEGDGPFKTQDFIDEVAEDLNRRVKSDEDVTGIPSGFKELDEMTVGFERGDYVVIAGRPSMGKTALALNIAQNVSLRGKQLPTVFFSLEMEKVKLVHRMLSAEARVDSLKIRTGDLTDGEIKDLKTVMDALKETPMWIDDTSGLSPMQIRAKLRRIRSSLDQDIGMVFVDYMQLMVPSSSAENRQQEVASISRELKALGKEFKCPVVALSQLNRQVEERSNKRPMMSDLRESGAIEQDADLVLFPFRPEYYGEGEDKAKGYTELIIGKQRNGPTGSVGIRFVEEQTRFEDFDLGM